MPGAANGLTGLRSHTRRFRRVFARAEQLHDRQREVGEAIGLRLPPLLQERVERDGVGCRRQLLAELRRERESNVRMKGYVYQTDAKAAEKQPPR